MLQLKIVKRVEDHLNEDSDLKNIEFLKNNLIALIGGTESTGMAVHLYVNGEFLPEAETEVDGCPTNDSAFLLVSNFFSELLQ